MIRGYFSTQGSRRRPFIDAVLQFPTLHDRSLDVKLLVDTGADRTILSPLDARRLVRRFALYLVTLPTGALSTGVGGQSDTRTLQAVLILDTFSLPTLLTILDPPPGPMPRIPSLLGRDILSYFALFVEEPPTGCCCLKHMRPTRSLYDASGYPFDRLCTLPA